MSVVKKFIDIYKFSEGPFYQTCQRLWKKHDLSAVLDFCHFSHKYKEQALVIAIEIIPQCGQMKLLGAANSISKLHCGLQDIILPYYKQAVKPYILDNIEQYVTDSEDRLFLYEMFDTSDVFSQLWKEYFLTRRGCIQQEILDLFCRESTCREEVYEECFNSKDSWKKCWAITYRHKHTCCGWDELKPYLLSTNTELQLLAEFVLEKEMDVPLKEFYRQHLGDKNPFAAIIGILKYGEEEAGMDLLKHINDYHGRCLYTAIQALASTLREKAIDTYWYYLQHAPSYKVAKEACRALKKCGCRDLAEYGSIQSEFGKIIVAQMYQ